MFLRSHRREKDGKEHSYWSLVETVRTPDGPRQRTLCYLGELNSSAQARWLKTIEVFNEQGEAQQLKLFPSQVEPPPDDPQVARVLLNQVRLERTRQFAAAGSVCSSGNVWSWTGSSKTSWMIRRPTCRGRVWRQCWRLTVCVRRAASWRSRSAGIQPQHSMICWASKKARSTTHGCTAAWTGFCHTRRNWSGISSNAMGSCLGRSSRCCCMT